MLRRFQTPAALLGPAEVMAAAPVVVVPPPMTIPPGPAPETKDRFCGKLASRAESRLKAAREKPTRNVFRICGEMMWVSSRLATWLRRTEAEPKNGSARGIRLLPSSMVYEAEKVSRDRKL